MNIGDIRAELSFEPIAEIGHEGRNSTVYRSRDKQLDAEIVTKRVEKARLNAADYFTEAKRLYDSSHPNVVPIKYACEDADHIYLAMPYYANGSLKRLIGQRFLTVREILRYSINFLQGLNNIHVKRLIHCDIKPDNVLLSDTDEALIADFGLAKNMNLLGLTAGGQVYNLQAPPEAFQVGMHGVQFDIYMAGATIYRLCNGDGEFRNQVQHWGANLYTAIQQGDFPNRGRYLPHIPTQLRTAVNKAMQVNQNNRFATVLDFINRLSNVDSFLDWRLDYPQANVARWVRTDVARSLMIEVTHAPNTAEIRTTKTILQSGNTSRIIKHCHAAVAAADIETRVQGIITDLD